MYMHLHRVYAYRHVIRTVAHCCSCVYIIIDAVEQAPGRPESSAGEKGEGEGGGGGGGGLERDHGGVSEDGRQVSETSDSNEREHPSRENEEEMLNDIKKQV